MAKPRVVPSFAPEEDVTALAEAKLASSGLTKEDAKKLGITWLTCEEVKTLHKNHFYLPALKIAYKDPLTKKPLVPKPNHPEFYRLRALRDPVPMPKDFAKYLQEPNTGTSAYFPASMDWSAILDDWHVPLIVTEGELKAAKTCKEGIPTIGLGGVWSWRSMKQGWSFLPELENVVWARRDTFVIFDSDSRSNPAVCEALQAFAEELQERGAYPRTVILPSESENGKTGLDDYLLKHPVEDLEKLLELADHLTLAIPLWNFNKTHVYIKNPGLVVEQATGFPMKPESFRSHATTRRYALGKVLTNGTISREMVGAADEWVKWPMREEAARIAYCPGKDPFTVVEDDGQRVYNTWPGWAAEPKKGDVSLFVKLIDHLCTDVEPEAKKYLWQWMAWPIVHPGSKLFVSAVLTGLHQGTGKSLVGMTLGKVYGDNYTMVTQENMEGDFNNWANSRQFVLVDDVTSSDRRRDIDRLKAMITREKIWINIKHIPEYSVVDCINYMFSSNHQDVLFLDQKDRRFFVLEVRVAPLSEAFYAEYNMWLKGPDAVAALHYHLKHDVDLTGFNPNAPPPFTAAKSAMIKLAQTDIEAWIRDAVVNPEAFLRVGSVPVKGDLLSLAELRACYTTFSGRDPDITQIGFARKLAACGVKMVNGGQVVYVASKPLARYYALKRPEYWLKASLDTVKRHLGEIVADEKLSKLVKNPVDE